MKRFDIAITGGGTSGLAAAITAKRTNERVTVGIIERLPKTGKKILATGNGRCNLTNADLSPDRYSGSCKKLLALTGGFSVTDFLESLGVICDDDGYGRIYPHCRSAASVLDALRLEAGKLGIEEICGYEVSGIEKKNFSGNCMFTVYSGSEMITAKKVILAGGGMSQQSLGSNVSILKICEDMGIRTVSPFPALVPLKTEPSLVKPLKGQRADANVMFCANGNVIASQRGEVQFTDGLLSGICVFDLSYLYEEHRKNCELRLDLLPDMSRDDVIKLLKNVRIIRSDASADDLLSGIFTRPLGIYVIKRALSQVPKKAGNISDEKLGLIADTIGSLSFPITGTAGFERSQVTGGGIIADEITDTFGLKRIEGMYACGELLDIIGACGGYNLDFAFSSGAIAGKNAALRTNI